MNAKQMLTMFKMQEEMNNKVNPNWRSAGYDWYRAIWMECAEMMDHIGWKWWKKQEVNIAQVKMELVDVWHFILSTVLEYSKVDEITDEQLTKFTDKKLMSSMIIVTDDSARFAIERFVGSLLHLGHVDTNMFFSICAYFGLSDDELYRMYVSKNVLNMFRQNNGYKEGTYIKTWGDGREDNEHLVDVQKTFVHEYAPEDLYDALGHAYQASNVGKLPLST